MNPIGIGTPHLPSPGLTAGTAAGTGTGAGAAGAPPEFKNFLLEALGQVNDMQQQADQAVEKIFTGGEVNTVEVLSAVQKADMSFRMMMQVRNKLVQVYQEIKDIRI